MSARDRAERLSRERERRFVNAAMEGMRQSLNSPDGRAFIWWLYSENVNAEGEGTLGQRIVAREVLKAALTMDFPAVQIMREEWEQPRLVSAEAGEEEGEE